MGAYRHAVHALTLQIDPLRGPFLGHGALAAIRSRALTVTFVRYPGGRVVCRQSPTSWPLFSPARPGPISGAYEVQLQALDSSLRAPPVPAPSASEVASLHKILAASIFHEERSVSPLTLLGQWLSSLLPAGHHLTANPAPFATAGLIIVLAIIGLAAILARRTTRRAMSSAALAMPGDREMTSFEALRRADELVGSGRLRDALRYVLLGVLLELQKTGLIDVWAELTNRELLDHLKHELAADTPPSSPSPRPSLEALSQLIETFDGVWYGHRGINAELYRQCEVLAQAASPTAQRRRVA